MTWWVGWRWNKTPFKVRAILQYEGESVPACGLVHSRGDRDVLQRMCGVEKGRVHVMRDGKTKVIVTSSILLIERMKPNLNSW